MATKAPRKIGLTLPLATDVEAIAHKAKLLGYGIQGLMEDVRAGTEMQADDLIPVFEAVRDIERLAKLGGRASS